MKEENHIRYEFQVQGIESWHLLPLALEEYFDLEDGEDLTLDSPVNKTHFSELLGDLLKKTTAIRISLNIGGRKRRYSQSFWGEGRSSIVEIVDDHPPFREVILSLAHPPNEGGRMVLRLTEHDLCLLPSLHVFTQVDSSLSEVVHRVNLDEQKSILRRAGKLLP